MAVGDGVSLIGFLLLAWAPITYSIIGICYRVTRPMPAKRATRLLKNTSRLTLLLQGSACGVAIVFAVLIFDGESTFQTQIVRSLFTVQAVFNLCFSVISKVRVACVANAP